MHETAASLRDNTTRAMLARQGEGMWHPSQEDSLLMAVMLVMMSPVNTVPHKQNSVQLCTTQEWPGRGLVDQRSAWYKYSQLCSNKAWPSLSSSDTRLPMVLTVQNHDSWKCDKPSIKDRPHQPVKSCPALCMVCLDTLWLCKACSRCVCVCFNQVEHVHPSPGSVRCRRGAHCQNPGLLLSVSLLLKPTVPGRDVTVQRKAGVILVTHYAMLYSIFHYAIGRLQHWWRSGHNMEKVAWFQWSAKHGPWIFRVRRWVWRCNCNVILRLRLSPDFFGYASSGVLLKDDKQTK